MYTFILLTISIFIYSVIYYFICNNGDFYYRKEPNILPFHQTPKTQPSNSQSITDRVDTIHKNSEGKLSYLDLLYFSVISQSTIGYGDIVPRSNLSRFIVILQVFTTLAILELAVDNLL